MRFLLIFVITTFAMADTNSTAPQKLPPAQTGATVIGSLFAFAFWIWILSMFLERRRKQKQLRALNSSMHQHQILLQSQHRGQFYANPGGAHGGVHSGANGPGGAHGGQHASV